ncbi:retrovirus-related pol polyprotein from transposon TNT 1-94 [Tanacetum coccineum]
MNSYILSSKVLPYSINRLKKTVPQLLKSSLKTTHRRFLLQLQPERQRFVKLVKQSQELKTVSYHKLYDILKQHQNEVNEIRDESLARTANPLALVAQQQPVYHPQSHPTHYTNNSSTRSQQATTRNREKAIVNYPPPTYDQEPKMVAQDDALSKKKDIDKLMALFSLSFKKIYKPTNNNLRTSSNTSRANQDNTLRINRGTGYDNQRVVNVVGARENVGTHVVQQFGIQCYNCKEYGHVARECHKPKWVKDVAYHKEKMLLCKQEEAGFQLNAEQANWRDDTDDEPEDQELKAHYIEHPEQPDSVNDTYPVEQDEHNIIIDSLDMSYDREQDDQDDNDDLAKERDLLASLIKKLKCEIDDSKNRNKFLETSNKALVDKLKGEIENFKTKNKSLESSNNHFKEPNNKLSKTNQLMFKDLKKFQAELDSFVKPEFLKKAQRANPRLYDIGCYNDNVALMLALESDQTIRIAQESRSKLSDLIILFDYEKLNNLYDLFVPQREKSPEQRYFSKRSKMSHTPVKNENSKESFNKQTTLLEKRMDESIP